MPASGTFCGFLQRSRLRVCRRDRGVGSLYPDSAERYAQDCEGEAEGGNADHCRAKSERPGQEANISGSGKESEIRDRSNGGGCPSTSVGRYVLGRATQKCGEQH
jgi:hypothetical protein